MQLSFPWRVFSRLRPPANVIRLLIYHLCCMGRCFGDGGLWLPAHCGGWRRGGRVFLAFPRSLSPFMRSWDLRLGSCICCFWAAWDLPKPDGARREPRFLCGRVCSVSTGWALSSCSMDSFLGSRG